LNQAISTLSKNGVFPKKNPILKALSHISYYLFLLQGFFLAVAAIFAVASPLNHSVTNSGMTAVALSALK